MKRFTYTFALALALLVACERPPVSKDVDRNTIDHTKMAHGSMDHSNVESSAGAAEQPYELQFIDTMIAHHQGAVDMAMLAETRAQHEELKSMARNISAGQQKEIAQMKQWREEWFAGKPAAINMNFPGMRAGMHGMDMAKLDTLKANEFDLEFIKQMIPHHEGAVAMAKDAVSKAPADPAKLTPMAENFRTFAELIVRDQEEEIARMRGWQSTWSN